MFINCSNSSNDLRDLLVSSIENRPVSKMSMIFATLFALTFIFGIFTNAIVILVFAIKSEFRQYTNYFFTNLSIADILVLLVCIPVAITDQFSPDIWNYGSLYCKMYFFIEYCVTSVSSLTIIFISVERFFAIASPWTVKQVFNEKNSITAIVLIWLFGISISMPFLSMVEFTTHPDQCQMSMTKMHMIYVSVLNIILIFIPIIGLAVLYTHIIIKLTDHYKLFTSRSNSNSGDHAAATAAVTSPKHSITLSKSSLNKNAENEEFTLRVHRNNLNKRHNSLPNYARYNLSKNNKANNVFAETRSCSICFGGHGKRYECRCSRNSKTTSSSSKSQTEPQQQQQQQQQSHIPLIQQPTLVQITTKNSIRTRLSFESSRLRRTSHKNSNLNTSKFNFTIVISFVTLAFFCCQLPCRIFLFWSYLTHYFAPPPLINSNGEEPIAVKNDLFMINLIANLTKFIYFLHCISNPIIYNLLSIKFRKAFLSMTTFNKAPDCGLRNSIRINT